MNDVTQWWGIKENIGPGEIAARSAIMFLIALLLLRLAGMRPFGKGESFDKITTFLIGTILSRGVVGATPFVSTVVAAIVILLIHKLLSLLAIYSKRFGYVVKGEKTLLYRDGKFYEHSLRKAALTEHDIMEDLRLSMQLNSLEKIKEIYVERTGEISFVKKGEE